MMNICKVCGTAFTGTYCPVCGEEYTGPTPGAAKPSAASSTPTSALAGVAGGKLYLAFSFLPAALFAFIAVVALFLYLLPVVGVPVGWYGEYAGMNVFELAYQTEGALESSMMTLIAVEIIAIPLTLVLVLVCALPKGRDLKVRLLGNNVPLRNALTVVGFVLVYVLFAVSCVTIAYVKANADASGLKVGLAPILLIALTLFGGLLAVGCVIAQRVLLKKFPSLK